ncbi:PEP-CTERM protein-sorting domain-containing protein [Rubritalea squalenifaciens DSM 18772]|uniref:PEP-CTERM protein-sorting domain-containing protein n=1 Tax=Rubritalea squalenifaciens DSM 18772 TaxID=1123071 RepID=A0A1M6PA69_9BACT|nr:LamG-like jellyroll fold domain-containing protein [Rubritalea squalenifaciens]SHK04827.1 PEP-CTERM protein-sorting domain-containing protein [Rubritalea squalenifaciens DSM 18772]
MPFFLKYIYPALLISTSQAALVAHYDFADGNLLDNEVDGNYTLSEFFDGSGAVTTNPDGSALFPGNDGTNEAYLETLGPGGSPTFTVSLWIKTDDWTQGSFQGIFSNNISSAASFSWQLDSSGGDIRVAGTGASTSTSAAALNTDSWYHFVVRKTSTDLELYITEQGAGTANLASSVAGSPGGLQYFRLGANRNTDSLFRMDMANVKIYTDDDVSIDSLLAEGPELIPEPSTSLLFSLSSIALLLRRRR